MYIIIIFLFNGNTLSTIIFIVQRAKTAGVCRCPETVRIFLNGFFFYAPNAISFFIAHYPSYYDIVSLLHADAFSKRKKTFNLCTRFTIGNNCLIYNKINYMYTIIKIMYVLSIRTNDIY